MNGNDIRGGPTLVAMADAAYWQKRAETADGRVAELTLALREEWEAAHYDHCGLLPHEGEEKCYWPMPDALAKLWEV